MLLGPALAQHAGLPPEIASAGVTQSEWDDVVAEVRRQARRAGVAEAALLAAAERAGSNLARTGQFNAAALRDAIINRLQAQAQTITELQNRLTVLSRADDPEIARLLSNASIAIDLGRLEEADQLLAQAEESDLAAVAIAEARAERARARIADAIIERGRLERVYGSAPSTHVREAIAGYQTALIQIDRALAPRDWTMTQFNLGIAYAILAQGGESEARGLAVGALRAAASGFEVLQDEAGLARAERLIAALQAS
ncbi:MAG: hypothetical protein BroJett013_12210 [Alphaproteobacteria bacterium]|nr:MAG: hypothetical protein BroJett013_12210 [Alphaproteobacteria bacterium]